MSNNTDGKDEALKPCPFCGSDNLDLSNGYDEDANWVVVCRVCRSSGTFCTLRKVAIARWNSRASVAAPEGDAHWATPEIAAKLIHLRDTLTKMEPSELVNEAWHTLYSIADPEIGSFYPWAELEKRAAATTSPETPVGGEAWRNLLDAARERVKAKRQYDNDSAVTSMRCGRADEWLQTAVEAIDNASAVPISPTGDDAGEGFPWGTTVTIDGETYWLNQCLKCASTGQPTYHVIKGEPQPSLNELMDCDEDDAAALRTQEGEGN